MNIGLGTVQAPVPAATSVFIMNIGTLPLEVSPVMGYYLTPVVTQSFPVEVPPGDWVEVKLDFGAYHAPVIGPFTETARIPCNDPLTPEAQVVVTGTSPGIRGVISPEFIDFGTVALNSRVPKACSFVNKGTVDLHIEAAGWRSKKSAFTLSPSPVGETVAAGQSLDMTVVFGPIPAQEAFADYLVVETSEGISATLGVQGARGVAGQSQVGQVPGDEGLVVPAQLIGDLADG